MILSCFATGATWLCINSAMASAACPMTSGSVTQPRCQLCPHRGGAYKRTTCGQWVHVQCFLWIPEFRVEQGRDDMLVLGNLSRLDPDRKTLDCSLCHSRKGNGIIQCAHKRCLAAFHVSCAAFAHYRMDQLDPPKDEDRDCGTLFLAYCPLHRNSTAPPSQPTRVSSPSHLLASPSSVEAKKKFKTFRRLKRKYDASQSQMFSQPGAKAAPVSSSPWQQKRIRRSKRRRETSRVLAAAYIDDAADVRGARGDDDDEDDYGDDYKDAADDSFINDSSQLLYSQSVRKKSSPNMRAIYARSLFESQSSPLLLRRGGRQLGALPTNGIIRACLDELHNGSNDVDTPSPRPRSRSRVSETTEDAATLSALSASVFSASATVTEPDGDDSATEAEPSPSFKLLGAAKPLQTVQEEESATADCEVAPPCFSLLGTGSSANTSSTVTSRPQRWISSTDATDTSDELHKKIKANRLKALKKLEERRQARLQQAHARPLNNSQSRTGFTSAAALVSNKTEEEAGAIPKLAKPGSVQQPKWVIFVSSGFASSSSFPAFLSAKHADCTVAIVESMEADALLSVRTAVLFLTGEQLHEVARASPAHSVVKSRRVGMLLAMHKKLIIAVTHDVGDLPEVHRLRQFPNATVIVQPRVESLCTQLHEISQRELAEGYELPSPSQCRQEFKGGVVRGLDADFALRLKFFRSISPLSLGSALSLSFRFKNFPAMQVPVLKFNEMHWRRMLPWISETTAEEIREHVQQNVRR
ncbi:uncharacterized protein PITG_10591 [Phytophthora infestans T30-4]|uniref:PHD-type domain-containing protein n=1 Tax=Phytophthora infestans (strain T30-4) TaxID=403677 RepID=D0NFN9_PHYIT|nr:uncharacterized protein PITG_10591 [Phytophthora infestans T30-4]EEY57028.1 conserved hypothetical protein [Phytophthora infestans T30-4]|eukprot:XP_002902356.1 conserved hypothetical protein [Phytophthora infestans T30-4]